MNEERGHWAHLILPAVTVCWLVVLVAAGLSIEGAENPQERFGVFLVLVGAFSCYALVVLVLDKVGSRK